MRLTTTLTTVMMSGLLLAATGCSNQTTSTTAPDPRQAMKQLLSADPQLATVDMSENSDRTRVTVSGTVTTEQLRNEAVNMAKQAAPGATVVDRIEVVPAQVARDQYTPDMAEQTRKKAKVVGDKIGRSLDDAWLYTKVEAKLLSDSATPVRKINVDVVNKVVVLRGEVASPIAKQEAGRIAETTEGVRGVRNLLKVNS